MATMYVLLVISLTLLSLIEGRNNAEVTRVLVTGGVGFIGYHTALKLRENNIEVIILDNFNKDYNVDLKRSRANILKGKGVQIYEGNLHDRYIIEYIFKHNKLSGVVHLAGYTSISGSNQNPIKSIEDNTENMALLLDVLRKYKNVRLVYTSSSIVYGNDNKVPYTTTQSLPLPQHIMAAVTMSGESLVEGYCKDYQITAICLRLFSVYGPWSRPGTLVYDLASSLHDNKPLEIPHVKQTSISRDFVHINDVVNSIIAALKYLPKQLHTIYNVGSGIPTPVTKIAELLKQEMGRSSDMKPVDLPSSEPLESYADISLTITQLQVTPQVQLTNGIKSFVQWFIGYSEKGKDKVANSIFDRSLPSRAFDEYIKDKTHDFFERISDLRENYTKYAQAHNIPVAKFYRHKEFIYFPDYDTSDSGKRRHFPGLPLERLKELCTMIDECVAFNKGGELKGIIEPKSQWRRGRGVYVANIDVCQAGLHNCFGNSTCKYLGPSQFECGCMEGFGFVNGRCVELYREGRFSQTEANEKLADYIDGRDWKAYVGDKAGVFYNMGRKTSNYGELLYYPEAKGDVNKLKQACMKTYHCVGFTTDGVLRKEIDQPYAWRGAGHSLYVLDVDYCSLEPFRCPHNAQCRKERPGVYSC